MCLALPASGRSCDYGLLTWSTWLLAFVLIFAPLWFNPFSFDVQKVRGAGH